MMLADGFFSTTGAGPAVLLAMSILLAAGAIWRGIHQNIKPMREDVRLFLLDWNGEPARPGRDAVQPFPERMAKVERAAKELGRNGGHSVADIIHEIDRKIDDVKIAAKDNREALGRLDQRVTDHRRNNEIAAERLREHLEQRLMMFSADQHRLEAYRASLTELGIPVERGTDELPDEPRQ